MHLVGLAVLSVAAAALADVHIESYAGAHPYIGCRFRSTDDSPILALRASDGKFLVPREAWNTFKMDDYHHMTNMFKVIPTSDPIKCTHTHTAEAFFFTYFQLYGHSNYYHLHTDTLYPLFAELERRNLVSRLLAKTDDYLLIPIVNVPRTQDPDAPVDYNVDYFIPKHGSTTPPYYAQMIQLWTSHKPTRAKQSGPRRGLLELNTANFRTPATAVHCFHNASLALPRHSSYRDPTPRLFPSRFAHVVRTLLSLDHPEPIRVPLAPKDVLQSHRIGLVTRRPGRRGITNEQSMIDTAVSAGFPLERIEFSGKTYRQQVSLMRRFAVVIAMNGAGFMNVIYMPDGAVAAQLVPFNGTNVNWHQYNEIVGARGPSMLWFNNHPERTSPDFKRMSARPGMFSQADTAVHTGEFLQVIEDALSMVGGEPDSEQPTRPWSTMAELPCWV